MPAALAAWMPTGASSKTTERTGSTPAFVAATRKTCGSGLPRVMSSSEAIAANRPSRPHSATVSSRLARDAARADRQLHSAGRQGVEHLPDPVHQDDLAAGDVAIALLLQVRVAPDLVVGDRVAQQPAEDARVRHAEGLVDELRA